MSDNRKLTDYSPTGGLGFQKSNRTLTYLYGLSDFWATTFSDIETVNLLMEATSFEASEIYNKFLQLASGISLTDLQTKFNSQIELVYLTDSDLVQGTISTYILPDTFSYARYITNRPFLPTSSLEEGVDFSINESTRTITFSKQISNNGFAYRIQPDNSKKYAFWLVDVKTDNWTFYTEYASLLNITKPETITDTFKNFVYGMYYLYLHGPNLDLLRQGLNIALGIPVARDDETVLEIRKYLETDQNIVITSLNSYLIPYGLEASVTEGQSITVGTGLASWVEVKDHINDGDWWINLRLPIALVPNLPAGISRYATLGSDADILMRDYLKTHTFLVNVKTANFKNLQTFAELSDIIHAVRPSYTTPIYIWSVSLSNETLTITDDGFTLPSPKIKYCDPIMGDPITRHIRNSSNPLTRGCPAYTRFSGPKWVNDFIGRNPDLNGVTQETGFGTLSGFINQSSAIRTNTEHENAWIRALWGKSGPYYTFPKSYLSRANSVNLGISGTGYNYLMDLFSGFRVIGLYCTTEPYIKTMFELTGESVPPSYVFTLFQYPNGEDGINTSVINGSSYYQNLLVTNFSSYMVRQEGGDKLYASAPDIFNTFTPDVNDIRNGDFLIFTRNRGEQIGVYWATTNIEYNIPPYWEHSPVDNISMTVNGAMTRGLATGLEPVYMIRDYLLNESNYISSEINSFEIGGSSNVVDPSYSVNYNDTQNTNIPLTKSGVNLTFRRDFTE